MAGPLYTTPEIVPITITEGPKGQVPTQGTGMGRAIWRFYAIVPGLGERGQYFVLGVDEAPVVELNTTVTCKIAVQKTIRNGEVAFKIKTNPSTGQQLTGEHANNYFYEIVAWNVPPEGDTSQPNTPTIEAGSVVYDEDGQRVDTPAPAPAPAPAPKESDWDRKDRETRASIEAQQCLDKAVKVAGNGVGEERIPISDPEVIKQIALTFCKGMLELKEMLLGNTG
jgi:hypothetical protein